MTENVDWRQRLIEMQNANPEDDSLELGESWKGMPRPTEAAGNRTTGLYRRSVMPPLPVKNLYNIIIEKQPTTQNTTNNSKNTDSNEADIASAPKTLTPSVKAIDSLTPEDLDTLDFSKYLHSKDNGTSTPFPARRQNDRNVSPKRSPRVLKQAADSPNRNRLQVKSLIPISTTPRTSREPKDRNDRISTSQQQRPIRNNSQSSSPLVSSTVDTNENDEVQIISPKSQQALSPPHIVENVNNIFSDEDQREKDALTRDEQLFRRPQIVPRPSQKDNKEKLIDLESEPTSDQPQGSSQPNNSRRHKMDRKIDALLEGYKKVGESISNRTNSSQSQNFTSSTSSRRKLYRKGDSCTEDQIEEPNKPSNEGPCETNIMSSDKHEASIKPIEVQSGIRSGTAESDPNGDISVRSAKRTTESQRADILHNTGSAQIPQNVDDVDDPLNCDDGAELVTKTQNHTNSHTKKLQNQPTHSSNQQKDFEEDDSDSNSIDQSTSQKSVKQVLENILEDWSDSSTVGTSEKDNFSDSNHSKQPIHVGKQQQPSKESRGRPVRSENKTNEKVDVSPLKKPESQHGLSKKEQINLNVKENNSEEEDQIFLDKNEVPPLKQTQSRHIPSKKQDINSKNIRENDSEEEDDVLINKNNEEVVVPPSKKPERNRGRQKRQDTNTRNVPENASEEEVVELMHENNEEVVVPPSKKPERNRGRQKRQDTDTKNLPDEDDVELMHENNEEVVVPPSKKPERYRGRQKRQDTNTKNVPVNPSEEDEVELMHENNEEVVVPPSKKPERYRGRQKRQDTNTKNVPDNPSEEDDVELMYENNEEVVVPPSKKPGRRQPEQHINAKNVQVNDSEDEYERFFDTKEVPTSKQSQNRHIRSKKQDINSKNIREDDSEEDDVLINKNNEEVVVPPSKKPERIRGRPKRQNINTKNVPDSDSDEDVLIRYNNEEVVVPPSKKPERSRGRPKWQNINNVPENASGEEDEVLENEVAIVLPSKKLRRQHGRANEQRTNKQKARRNDSEEGGKPSTIENDQQEDVSSVKKTRSKHINDIVFVPPSEKPRSSHDRSNKQRINEEIVHENDSEGEDELMTSSICFDSNRMQIGDSEEALQAISAIEKKKPSSKSRAREEKQASKGSKGKNQQSKRPQTTKRHLDVEDEPKKTQSKAKKQRLNVEDIGTETNGLDQLENEIDENGNGNELSKKPKQSRLRKRQLDTVDRSETESTSQSNEQNDNLFSESSGSKTSLAKKHRPKKSKWEVPGTNSKYFPLRERENVQGTRYSTRTKRLPESNLIISVPRQYASRNTEKRNPAPKRRRNESVENETVYSMLLKRPNESVPPLITTFHGNEIATGFHTIIKEGMAIHHVPGETGPAYGYFMLEPKTLKRGCRISMILHLHVVSGTVVLMIDGHTETLLTGSFSTLRAGTKYNLRNDGENQALIFFHQHVGETSDETSENADMTESSLEASENAD